MVENFLQHFEKIVWGAPLLALLLASGVYLTFVSRFVQVRYLFYSLKLAFSRNQDLGAASRGNISHFEALMTALAATIGIGSVAGVATAIAIGGLGALFWLWIAAFLGMATKYSEAILALRYRVTSEDGELSGGPMYYLEKGFRSKRSGRVLAVFFAMAGAVAAFGTGNMVQAHAVSSSLFSCFSLSPWFSGLFLCAITACALFGGIKSIGKVSSYLVPLMAVLYVGGGLCVLFLQRDQIPDALAKIVKTAFTGQAATGGFLGSTLLLAVQYGVSRGIFSSEAGMGSAPIAAAAAKSDVPGRQALVSMSGVFITSFLVCTVTGLAIATSGVLGQVDSQGALLSGSRLVIEAFNTALPGSGVVITLSLLLFAYSTILGWAYYGEKCVEYLFGQKSILVYRLIFVAALLPGSLVSLSVVWSFANIMNGVMAIPNLLGLFALSSVVAEETRSLSLLLRQEAYQERSYP
ncbi:MAG: sodium:alanine symporter family protein [Chlamydiota bacterium]